VLDGSLHRSNIACQVFGALELGRPCHSTKNSGRRSKDSPVGRVGRAIVRLAARLLRWD
jgi:hypothetical protein